MEIGCDIVGSLDTKGLAARIWLPSKWKDPSAIGCSVAKVKVSIAVD